MSNGLQLVQELKGVYIFHQASRSHLPIQHIDYYMFSVLGETIGSRPDSGS